MADPIRAGPSSRGGVGGRAAVVGPTLKHNQRLRLRRMLNYNEPLPDDGNLHGGAGGSGGALDGSMFKVLIYDSFVRGATSPLMKKGDLRNAGVTLYLDLGAPREAIEDVAAVYVVQATEENVRRIARDVCAVPQLYASFYLNFVSPLSDELMDVLARETAAGEASHLIAQVYEQAWNFVSLEENLFDLSHKGSYHAIHAPPESEAAFEAFMDEIVDGLFSVCVTLGSVPVIRCPPGNAAEMISRRLSERIAADIVSPHSLFEAAGTDVGAGTYARPVLVVLDRHIDLAVALHHTWTYQAMVHDLFGMERNRLRMTAADAPTTIASTSDAATVYDLDSSRDSFWADHMTVPFPLISESIETLLEEHRAVMESVANIRSTLRGGEDDETTSLMQETREIADRMDQHTELKRVLDIHSNIAIACLRQIQDRNLDAFFFMEEDMMRAGAPNMQTMTEVLTTKGTVVDRLRFLLVHYWTSPNAKDSDLERLEAMVVEAGATEADMAALAYMKRHRAFRSAVKARKVANAGSKSGFDWKGLLTSSSNLLDKTGVRSWLPSNNDLTVVRIVQAVTEMKRSSEVADYLYIDPKTGSTSPPASRTSFSDAVVFMVGGGNYTEYHGLQDWASRQTPEKRVVYGSTEIVSPVDFLEQLQRLGASE